MEVNGRARTLRMGINTPEPLYLLIELCHRHELTLAAHLTLYLSLLYFRSICHTLGECLT